MFEVEEVRSSGNLYGLVKYFYQTHVQEQHAELKLQYHSLETVTLRKVLLRV